jgi:uncharacterized DUF497 family protein
MDVSFDPAKRNATLPNRGLDFADAGKLFDGHTVTVQDTRFDYGEDRYITAGYLNCRCVVLVWTPRGESRRVIQ